MRLLILVNFFLNMLKLGFSKVFFLHTLRDFMNSNLKINSDIRISLKEVCVF